MRFNIEKNRGQVRALVTGVNSLVNEALLKKLVDLKYEVTAQFHSDNEITKRLKAKYTKVTFVQADFSKEDSFLDFIGATMGNNKYDVLVNGAVYYAEAKDWHAQQDWDEWQKSFAVNTTTPGVLMAHADMVVNKGGVVINISSTYGQPYMGDVQFTIYSASKAALDSLTMSYAKRWSPEIRVVGIAPGWVKSAWNDSMTSKEVDEMITPQLTGRLVEPTEIAELMVTLINNPSINATTVVIDGGVDAPII